MSQGNLEIVRRFFDARNRRDVDALLACLHPEARFGLMESRNPYRGTYLGHEQIRRLFVDIFDAWDDFELSLADPIAVGDQVAVSVIVKATGQGSGVQLQAQGANVFYVRDDKIIRFRLFQGRDEALEAAGLEE